MKSELTAKGASSRGRRGKKNKRLVFLPLTMEAGKYRCAGGFQVQVVLCCASAADNVVINC